MTINLNWFSSQLSPDVLELPANTFETFEDTTKALQNELRDFDCYRPRLDESDGIPTVIVLNGVASLPDWPVREFSLLGTPGLGNRILLSSLNSHFRKRGAYVHQDGFHLRCHWLAEEHAKARIRLLTGLRIKAFKPSSTSPYGLVISWDVRAEFSASLSDDELRNASIGQGVILKPGTTEWKIPDVLRKSKNRFCGHVQSIRNGTVDVLCRDGNVHSIPPGLLYLEAKPSTMNAVEHRTGIRFPVRRMQELSLVLTRDGRRNSYVLRHRIDAITKKLSDQSGESLILPMQVLGGGKIIIDLVPAIAEGGGNVRTA